MAPCQMHFSGIPGSGGNVAGTLSVKLATGEVALEAGAEIDLGEYGTVKANDVCLVPAGDPLKFTKENAGEYDY